MEKNKVMLIIIIVLLIVLIGSIVGFVVYGIRFLNDAAKMGVPFQYEGVIRLAPEDISLLQISEPIATDLKTEDSDNKDHAIRFNIALGIDVSKANKKEGDKMLTTLQEREAIIRDHILSVVRNKAFSELKGVGRDAQSILKDEILKKLQMEFTTHLIVDVYISDLALQ